MFGFAQKVAQTKEILSKQAVQTKQILSKQAVKISKQAEEHERFINKVSNLILYIQESICMYMCVVYFKNPCMLCVCKKVNTKGQSQVFFMN